MKLPITLFPFTNTLINIVEVDEIALKFQCSASMRSMARSDIEDNQCSEWSKMVHGHISFYAIVSVSAFISAGFLYGKVVPGKLDSSHE